MWQRGILGLVVLVLVACQTPEPVTLVSPLASQLATVSPLATPGAALAGPNFEVFPIKAGATQVSGRGPTGLPITIVDVTLSARPLANGVIDQSGNFTIDLSKPAPDGHAIGIQVVDVTDTPYQSLQELAAQLDAKAGPGFQYYPMIGTVYAQTKVSP
jgi:hypothetical protein